MPALIQVVSRLKVLTVLGLLGVTACSSTQVLDSESTKTTPVIPKEPGAPTLIPPIIGGSSSTRLAVSKHFAPVVYQEVQYSTADFITRITFDTNWTGYDNWEKTQTHALPAWVYVSLIEDANRYFIFYGTYHPRDWCSELGPWGACFAGEDEHENDFEGMELVVDKRFATSQHPYGQIVTMETRSHYDILAYRNCNLDGGFQLYVTPSSGLAAFQGCIPFAVGYNSTSFSPPSRPVIYSADRTHAVSALPPFATVPGFRDHGAIYFPTNNVSEVPPGVNSTYEVAYRLQWIDSTEVTGINYSFWSQRLNLIMGNPISLFEHDTEESGPHDVYYLKQFMCSTHCPAIAEGRAKAPWGFGAAGQGIRNGDWHNHPAWAWSHRYAAVSGLESWMADYWCYAESCRLSNTYIHNPYWDDARWEGGYGGQGGPHCARPTCGLTSPPAFVGASVPHLHSSDIPPETRWDFDDLQGVHVTGSNSVSFSSSSVLDTDWGYPRNTARVLRLTGRGAVTLTLQGVTATSRTESLVLRLRRSSGVRIMSNPSWRDQATGNWVSASRSLTRSRVGDYEWEVLTLPLSNESLWKSMTKVDGLMVTIDLGQLQTATVDIDFVLIGS